MPGLCLVIGFWANPLALRFLCSTFWLVALAWDLSGRHNRDELPMASWLSGPAQSWQ